MKTKLTKKELDFLLPNIARVLITGDEWTDKTLHHPAGAIIAAVESLNGMEKDASKDEETGSNAGFSTNGWQWDWWQQFTHDGKRYTLSGSGFYGGHSFSVSEE
ncbi:MAG TPA: hypothetical protein VGO57_18005 [Verrucomicrobiae bacterium]|jgi:hypothetical protein